MHSLPSHRTEEIGECGRTRGEHASSDFESFLLEPSEARFAYESVRNGRCAGGSVRRDLRGEPRRQRRLWPGNSELQARLS